MMNFVSEHLPKAEKGLLPDASSSNDLIEDVAESEEEEQNMIVRSVASPGEVSYSQTDVNGVRLSKLYFVKTCVELAEDLLGKILVRSLPSGEILKGRIVETECYLGIEDKACHSYKGKITDRNAAMFMKPGTAYVYSIYGMYYCFNISSLEEGSAVLIRSLEPLIGLPSMHKLRLVRRKQNSSILKDRDLCNGPSKLCQALKIEKKLLNKEDLSTSGCLWLEDGIKVHESDIVACKRIGIDSAGEEWANKPLRFYIRNCLYVSVKNKKAEQNMFNC